jgi:IS30 family transposase
MVEIGHWESDTMIGGNHYGVIVTHVDKASNFLVAGLGASVIVSATYDHPCIVHLNY